MESKLERRTVLKGALAGAASVAGLLPVVGRRASLAARPVQSVPRGGYRVALPGLAGDNAVRWGLRDWANLTGVEIGTNISLKPGEEEVGKKEFNLANVWLEWEEPVRGQPLYSGLWQAKYSRQLNKKTFCSAIFAPIHYPKWLASSTFSRAELLGIIKGRVEGVMAAGKGLIDTYVVAHEPYEPEWGSQPVDVLKQWLGPSWVDYAFEVAREFSLKNGISPRLVYTDYDNYRDFGSYSARYEKSRSIVDRLRERGLIDAVGMEWTVWVDMFGIPTRADVIRGIQSYGIPVIITEFGVILHNLRGTREERFAKQADVYRTVLAAALDSGACSTIITPDLCDRTAYWMTADTVVTFADNDPCPFDSDMAPKPAYYAMLEVLKNAAQARGLGPG